MNKEANITLMTFFSLCLVLTELLEEKWVRNVHNRQTLKNLSNNLIKELEKVINELQRKTDMDSNDVEQFINAAWIMEHLFGIGVKIEQMENQIHKQTLITQLNILLTSYGLPQLELSVTRPDVQESNKNESE